MRKKSVVIAAPGTTAWRAASSQAMASSGLPRTTARVAARMARSGVA